MSAKWVIKNGTELTAAEVYNVLQLRAEIFVVEQNCPYQDIDDQDLLPTIYHVQGFVPGDPKVAAYLRIMYNDEGLQARIGRVVVAQKYRSQGLGRKLMLRALEAIADLQKAHPIQTVMLHGQAHLEKWYGEFGFEATHSEPFLEDGIPHLEMVSVLTAG